MLPPEPYLPATPPSTEKLSFVVKKIGGPLLYCTEMIGNCLHKTPNYFTKSDVSKPFNATPPQKKGGQKRKKKREKREWEEKGGREGDLQKKKKKTPKNRKTALEGGDN